VHIYKESKVIIIIVVNERRLLLLVGFKGPTYKGRGKRERQGPPGYYGSP